jgi:hypothetical protein
MLVLSECQVAIKLAAAHCMRVDWSAILELPMPKTKLIWVANEIRLVAYSVIIATASFRA